MSSDNPKSKPLKKEGICIVLLVVSLVCAFTLIGLNIAVIITAPKIKDSVDNVLNAQTSFNKLGMQLTTSAGEEDKSDATSLIVVESLTIGLHIPLFIALLIFLLFMIHKHQDNKAWKIIVPFVIVGCMQASLLFATAFYVDKLRSPTESNEINSTALSISLTNGYKDDIFPSAGNADSDTWNNIFIDFDCCAVNPVTSTTNDFDLTPWCTTSGSCQQTNSQIPKACCKGVDNTSYTSAPSTCHEYVNPGTYNDEGCYTVWSNAVKKLKDEEFTAYKYGVAAAVLHAFSCILFPCLLIMLTMIYIEKKIRQLQEKEKRLQIELKAYETQIKEERSSEAIMLKIEKCKGNIFKTELAIWILKKKVWFRLIEYWDLNCTCTTNKVFLGAVQQSEDI